MSRFRLLKFALALVAQVFACGSLFAQVEFGTGKIQSAGYPMVQVQVSVSKDGKPAKDLLPSNFSITEDGKPVTNQTLLNCDLQDATIAVLLDTSNSISFSAGLGAGPNKSYAVFNDGISNFLKFIPAPSQLLLIPFSDTARYSYPSIGFFNAGDQQDTSDFMRSVASTSFNGERTYIDRSIEYAIGALRNATVGRKVILLISDDVFSMPEAIAPQLLAENISFYEVHLGRETIEPNTWLATETGGKYYANPVDSSLFVFNMGLVAREIMTGSCVLRYTSTLNCPWRADHAVSIRLDYAGEKKTALGSYYLGSNPNDRSAPIVTSSSPTYITRRINASEIYPCETGLKVLTDSGLKNFVRLRHVESYPFNAYDSVIVTDSLRSATGAYLARDSSGNVARLFLTYEPKPDTIQPQLPPVVSDKGKYIVTFRESMPWDRGLKDIVLANAANVALDSVHYFSRELAQAWLHVIDTSANSTGCLIARDSVDNASSYCIQTAGGPMDVLPPVFIQFPYPEPRITMTGDVAEKRPSDIGIAAINVTPLSNCSSPTTKFFSKASANIGLSITDSLFPARAYITAMDSVGNQMADTMKYEPVADDLSPMATVEDLGQGKLRALAVEIRPWDRGIKSVSVNPTLSNLKSTGPIFTDARHAEIAFSAVDPYVNGYAEVLFTDSADNIGRATLNYNAQAAPQTTYLGFDFKTVFVGKSSTLTQTFTNTSGAPITITGVSPIVGAPFTLLTSPPFTIPASGTYDISVRFDPTILNGVIQTVSLTDASNNVPIGLVLRGVGSGTIDVFVDSVRVSQGGRDGVLHLSIDAWPKPVNFDHIQFDLRYDDDMIAPIIPPAGIIDASSNGIYKLTLSQNGEVSVHGDLVRTNGSALSELSYGSSHFSIPFQTFVGKDSVSAVQVVNLLTTDPVDLTGHPGQVTVGEACNDHLIRASMNGALTDELQKLSIEPKRLTADIETRGEGERTITIVNMLGAQVLKTPVATTIGTQRIQLDISSLPSCPYIFVLSNSRSHVTARHGFVIQR